MNEEQLKATIDSVDPEGQIPDETVMELVAAFKEIESRAPPIRSESYAILREQLSKEPDWRRRAGIAARIISLGLE